MTITPCRKRARRNPSPRMIKVTVLEETRGQWKKWPNPATPHTQSLQRGVQTTSRSSALVRGRSTQFIANPCRCPQRPCLKWGYISAIFPPFPPRLSQVITPWLSIVVLGRTRWECSKRNYYIISPKVIIKANIITKSRKKSTEGFQQDISLWACLYPQVYQVTTIETLTPQLQVCTIYRCSNSCSTIQVEVTQPTITWGCLLFSTSPIK